MTLRSNINKFTHNEFHSQSSLCPMLTQIVLESVSPLLSTTDYHVPAQMIQKVGVSTFKQSWRGCGTEEMSKAQLRPESTYTDGSAASPHDNIVVNRR